MSEDVGERKSHESGGGSAARVRGVGNGPVAGRFVLLTVYNGEEGYVTSWDTWEECEVAFEPTEGDRIPRDFKLIDQETGREWLPGAPYEWEAART